MKHLSIITLTLLASASACTFAVPRHFAPCDWKRTETFSAARLGVQPDQCVRLRVVSGSERIAESPAVQCAELPHQCAVGHWQSTFYLYDRPTISIGTRAEVRYKYDIAPLDADGGCPLGCGEFRRPAWECTERESDPSVCCEHDLIWAPEELEATCPTI